MSYYHLFVKSRCPHCKEAKDLLKSEKKEHVVTSMDKAPSVLDRLKVQMKHETVPIIFEVTEGEKYNFVGGCSDLKEVFNAKEIQKSTGEVGEESLEEHERSSATANSMPTDS
jgi:glutaredoxin